jgi:DNA-binding NtrC family response regulator
MARKNRKYRVLVVDDEPAVLLTYRMILEQKGYEVNTATCSRDARAALDQGGTDLLLCDLSLEEQHSGFDVIEYARQTHPEMRSVMLTGYATKEIADRAEREGIPVLFKPIDIEEFLGTIAAQLRSAYEQQTKNSRGQRAVTG